MRKVESEERREDEIVLILIEKVFEFSTTGANSIGVPSKWLVNSYWEMTSHFDPPQ